MCIVTVGVILAGQILLVAQVIWLCSGLGMAWGAMKLKERVTSPRGGYVAFDEHTVTIRGRISRRGLNVVLMFGMVGFIVAFRDVFNFRASRAVAVNALFLSAYMFEGMKYRMPHMLWLAAFSALLGVWVYARNDSLWFVILWQGGALAIAGGTKLWRFIKSHPRPVET